jgi:hypothetical protein
MKIVEGSLVPYQPLTNQPNELKNYYFEITWDGYCLLL